ncbi:MAG: hypothetical protein GXO90_11020 [FCB group bacterium]|nr:hypothetical protein [FCB group bacterium]
MPEGDSIPISFPLLHPREKVLPVLAGFHFGLLQVSSYFLFQCYYTATYMGYFFISVIWIAGVVLNLRFAKPKSFRTSLLLSTIAYGLLALGLVTFIPTIVFLPIYGILILATAAPAGALFRTRAESQSTAQLFFHENNGFILGFVTSLLGFVQWGVRAPFILPFISLALIMLVYFTYPVWLPILLLGILGMLSFKFYGLAALLSVLVVTLCLSRSEAISFHKTGFSIDKNRISVKKKKNILFLSGVNLILLQFFITREFSTLLAASELSVLIVATAYFIGYSVGYLAAPRIPNRFFLPLGWVTLFLHLDIFLFLKYFASMAIYLGAGWWALIGILFFSAFVTSSFYSLFLPRFTEFTSPSLKLVRSYSRELAGAVAGTGLLILFTLWFPQWIQPVYFAIFFLILWMLSAPHQLWTFQLIAAIGILVFLLSRGPGIKLAVTQDYYAMRGYSNPSLCYQANSMYHTIEILDTHSLPGLPSDGRWSFINGVLYFGYQANSEGEWIQETGLSEFTYFLAELPAQYQYSKKKKKLNILILGCGSMYSVGRVGPFAKATTLVEIDPDVVQSAKKCWGDLNQFNRWTNTQIIIDDAKHFIRTDNKTYDLIVMDISAPYTLGTMLLHNQDFFNLLKSRLAPGGLFAESTQGSADPDYPDSQAMKILAGIISEYPQTMVLNTGNNYGNHGFVYASLDSTLDVHLIDSLLTRADRRSGVNVEPDWRANLDWSQITPFSYTHMETLLSGNYWRLSSRLGLDRTLIDLDWMRRRWIKLESLHLRFPQIIRDIFRTVWIWVWFGGLVVSFGWSIYSKDSNRHN